MRERQSGFRVGPSGGLPAAVRNDLDRAGYYPAFVGECLEVALGGEEVHAHLVHQETTFDHVEVRRHVTVLVLTAGRLLVVHADDHDPDDVTPEAYASASTEAVPLERITSVVLTHAVTNPATYRRGATPRELTLTISWGSVARIDLEPAGCADPNCEADHGYTGTLASDDITVRVSAAAEGADAVHAAVAFARAVSSATTRH